MSNSSTNIASRILGSFLNCGFSSSEISNLWSSCPNKYLWEALKFDKAIFIDEEFVKNKVATVSSVVLLPEPLSAIYLGVEPAHTIVRSKDIIVDQDSIADCKGNQILTDLEPLYIVDENFTWMIVLTTENTPDGKQLCVFVPNIYSAK
jgi:hypothetical protein